MSLTVLVKDWLPKMTGSQAKDDKNQHSRNEEERDAEPMITQWSDNYRDGEEAGKRPRGWRTTQLPAGQKKQGYFTSSANVLNYTEGEGAGAGENSKLLVHRTTSAIRMFLITLQGLQKIHLSPCWQRKQDAFRDRWSMDLP